MAPKCCEFSQNGSKQPVSGDNPYNILLIKQKNALHITHYL